MLNFRDLFVCPLDLEYFGFNANILYESYTSRVLIQEMETEERRGV